MSSSKEIESIRNIEEDVASIKNTPSLPTDAALASKQDIQIAAEQAILEKLTADPATQTTLAAILTKIIAAPATEASLAALTALISSGGLNVNLIQALSSSVDSIDVAKKSKGAVTVAHNAITATATSAEVDCRGFNSLNVHWVSNQTDKTWTISILSATGSGLTFVPLLDSATGLAVSIITTDISGTFPIYGVFDYVKIVATEIDDGATVTCKVQPFNM